MALCRLGRRFEGTWLTFPLLVLAVTLGSVAWLQHGKGDTQHLNQIDIVDWDMTSGLVRGTSWYQLYSPANLRWDLEFQPPDLGADATESAASAGGTPPARPQRAGAVPEIESQPRQESAVWLSWLGGRSGVAGSSGQPGWNWGSELEYHLDAAYEPGTGWRSRIRELPMEVATSRGLTGRWWDDWKQPAWGELELMSTTSSPGQCEIRSNAT